MSCINCRGSDERKIMYIDLGKTRWKILLWQPSQTTEEKNKNSEVIKADALAESRSVYLQKTIYYNIITVLSATIIQLKSFKTFLKL
jgi:hypothetical protein